MQHFVFVQLAKEMFLAVQLNAVKPNQEGVGQ